MAPIHTLFLVAPRTVEWHVLRETIQGLPDAELLGDTADADAAVGAILTQRPELVLIAARLNEETTAQYVGALCDGWPACRIVVLTERFDRPEYRFCARLGVVAYLLREEVDAELLDDCLAGALSPKGLLVGRALAFAATAGPPLKVLLAGPHDIAMVGLEALLRRDPRFVLTRIVRQNANLIDAARSASEGPPDLIIFDPCSGGGLDLSLIANLAAAVPASRRCIFTSVFDPDTFWGVWQAGAQGYLLKGSLSDRPLLDALATLAGCGGLLIDPAVLDRLQEAGVRFTMWRPEPQRVSVSARQRQVIALVKQRKSNKEIAEALVISAKTVEDHLGRLFEKLEVSTRQDLVDAAQRQGLVADDVGHPAQPSRSTSDKPGG